MRIRQASTATWILRTRDRYRHAVEKIAKSSLQSEGEVARHAILLARKRAAEEGKDDRAAHVGFYLVDKGQPQLEQCSGHAPVCLRNESGDGADGRCAGVSRFHSPSDGDVHRRLPGPRLYRGMGWVETRVAGTSFGLRRQSIGGDIGELARDGAGDAASPPANGLYRWSSPGITNLGRRPDAASECAAASTTSLRRSKFDSWPIGTATCTLLSLRTFRMPIRKPLPGDEQLVGWPKQESRR